MRKVIFRNRILVSFFSVLSVAVFFCLSISAQEKAAVTVAAETTVENEIVRLGEIAEISGGTLAAKLKSITLGYAPNVGATREINRAQILLALAAAGLTENEIVFNAPAKILLRRAGQEISRERIRAALEQEISAKFEAEKIEATLARFDAPEKTLVPVGELEIRVSLAGVHNYFQPFAVPVEIRANGKIVRRFSATAQIEAAAEVFVAAKDLSLNAKIGAGDVRTEKRRLEKPLFNYLRDETKLRGLMTVKNLSAGSPVTTDSFVSGVVVKSGDRVRIEAESGKVKIVVAGEARASGKIGDRIAVKNSQSGAVLQATVVDEGLVRINF